MKIKTIQPPADGLQDAQHEQDSLQNDEDLEKASRIKRHTRGEQILDVLHDAVCMAICVACFAILMMGCTWVWHIITPWQYLSDDQLDTIKNTIFSGAIGGIIADRLRNIK